MTRVFHASDDLTHLHTTTAGAGKGELQGQAKQGAEIFEENPGQKFSIKTHPCFSGFEVQREKTDGQIAV